MSTRKGFVVVTANGKYVMSLADKRFTVSDDLSGATVYDMRQLADITMGSKKSQLLIDDQVTDVVMVEAYTTRIVKLGVPPVEE